MNNINYVNEYFKKKFGERTLKICIDGHFTCPNRDGTCGIGGCIFCGERGSGEHIKSNIEKISKSISTRNMAENVTANISANNSVNNSTNITEITKDISNQVKQYFNSYRASRANKFIVYFQNFTNTYDTIENLKAKYDSALIDDRIVGISIATRPDCINEEIVKLLALYKEKYYVEVELGLQTANDEVGKKINRSYLSSEFTKATKLLNKYNIDVVAHIMVGLPNETFESIKETVNFINSHKIAGIKVHSTYIIKNTKLAEMYLNGKYTPITLEYYLDTLSFILTHISPKIVVHRLSGDAPKDLLLAPDWNLHKKWILNGIDKKFKEENLKQGMYFKN